MKLLMTGASGFVGQALRQHLLARQHAVAVLNKDDLSPALACNQYDCLIHLAGRAHVMRETATDVYQAYKAVNVDYTLKVAAMAAQAGVKRFVYLSSVKVHGESTVTPFTEDSPTDPQDDYGKTKLAAEQALQAFCLAHGMALVIIRPPLIYGPGVKANFLALLKLCQWRVPLPFGNTQNRRSLVSLANLCDFITLCCQHPLAANQTFLISDDDDVSTTQMLTAMRHALGRKPWLVAVPPAMIKFLLRLIGKSTLSERLLGNLQVDVSKAKTLLGWQSTLTFQQGISQMVAAHGH